jgi:hypothetical protein
MCSEWLEGLRSQYSVRQQDSNSKTAKAREPKKVTPAMAVKNCGIIFILIAGDPRSMKMARKLTSPQTVPFFFR